MFKKINEAGWVETLNGIEVCMANDGMLQITSRYEAEIIEVPLKSLLKNAHMYLTADEINEMKVKLCKIIMKI